MRRFMESMLKEIKKKDSGKKAILLIPSIVVLLFLCITMLFSVRSACVAAANALISAWESESSMVELCYVSAVNFTETLESELQSGIYKKNDLINLNGLTAKLLGFNSLNERQKLKNGYLSTCGGALAEDYLLTLEEAVIDLNDFLAARDIEFLYVLAPSKHAMYDAELALGYENNAYKNIDAMIDALETSGVNAIDMDAWFEENGWSMEDVFYQTDHHWRPQSGLAAAQITMEWLEEKGLVAYDEELLSADSWNVTTYENWFLGSHGKRVGVLYVGVDDFEVYVPGFETAYAYSYLTSGTTMWTYTDTLLDLGYLDEPDYFNENPYCVYMIGDYPLRRTVNTKATNASSVLIIGDSFKMTYEYFLTTQFQEVYTIDLRYYTDGTLAQFIEEICPDVVLMCTYEGAFSVSELYSFGVEDYLSALESTAEDAFTVELGSYSIEAQEDNGENFAVVVTSLVPGETYTLTIDSTSTIGSEGEYIQMTLQNLSTNTAIVNRYLDANSTEAQKWIFTVPANEGDEDTVEAVDGEDTYAIYLYAGTKGYTENISVAVSGICIIEGVAED